MPKPSVTKDNLEENLFGNFKFIDQQIPKDTIKDNKEPKEGKTKGEIEQSAAAIAAEAKALEEAALAAEAREKKKAAAASTEEEEEEIEEEEELELEEEEETEEEEDKESPIQLFAKELRDKGLLDLEETDEIKSDEDLFAAYEKTLNKARAEDRAKLPEDAQRFLEFMDNGGNPGDFHKYYYPSDGGSFEEFEIKTEEDQEHVVREGLALEGYSEEEIEDQVADFKDLGKLEKRAETHLKKLQKAEKDQKKLLLEAQKEYARKQEEKRAQDWADFKKGLFGKEEISGFKFNDKMKTDTWDYMTKIVDRKNNLTQYQIDSSTNPDARYMFAYLLKNKWDVKSLEKQVTTKVAGKLASKLSKYSDTRQKVTKGTPVKEQKEGTSPFSGFKEIL